MFVQVITAKVVDEDALWRQLDRWDSELRPGAEGFLGSTGGVTDDGRLIALVRFESADAARQNSERPEQSEWWAEVEKAIEDPTFQDSTDVDVMGGGAANDAGFVQVMRGRVVDSAKLTELRGRMKEFESAMAQARPDVIGDITAIHPDGTFTNAVYFRSESEARANEAKEMPAEMMTMFGDWMAAAPVDEYLDLKNPRVS